MVATVRLVSNASCPKDERAVAYSVGRMPNQPPAKVPPRRKGAPVNDRTPRNRPPARRARRGRSRGLLYGGLGVAVIVAAVVLIAVLISNGGSSSTSGGHVDTHSVAINWKTPAGLAAYGALGPENVPIEVGPQLAPANTGLDGTPRASIQCAGSEQTLYHHHVHVAIFVNGKPYSIPIGVGITPPAAVEQIKGGPFAVSSGNPNGCFYWIHVHAQDGIVHMESPIVRIFELGQFFGVWGQPISSDQLGPYKGAVSATVNGVTWSGNPAQIPMNAYDNIVLNLGGPIVAPPAVSWTGTGL